MFDLKRSRGVISCLAAIGMTICVEGAVWRAFAPSWNALPHRHAFTEISSFESIGSVIAGFVKMSRSDRISDAQDRLGIVLGSSTTECSIDPFELEKLDPESRSFLNLNGSGCNAVDLNDLYDLIDFLGVRPNTLVVGLNPGMLADPKIDPKSENRFNPISFYEHVRNHHAGLAFDELNDLILEPVHACLPRFFRFKYELHRAWFQARIDLLEAFHQKVDVAFRPADVLWSGANWVKGDHVPPWVIEKQVEGFRHKGWFDAVSYRDDGANASSLSNLIAKASERGSHVFIVLLPESTPVRSREPAAARIVLKKILADRSDHNLTFLDFQSRIDDDLFYDAAHLNAAGRKIFTKLLGEALVGTEPKADRTSTSSITPRRYRSGKTPTIRPTRPNESKYL
jgi:hypothetical protein